MTDIVDRVLDRKLLSNSEYQQALVRLAIWFFCILFTGLASKMAYYPVDTGLYVILYGGYFLFFLMVLVSIAYRPNLPYRKGAMLPIDVSASSLAIVLTGDAISPFYMIYFWICLSYGIRYGKQLLLMAMLFNFFAYNGVLIYLHTWQGRGFDAFFLLLLLLVTPLSQYFLMRRLHLAKEQAESAKKARGEFLTTMVHELKTPLNDVVGMVGLMRATPLDREQKEYLHSIQSSAHMLKSLVSDVEDLSKIDANELDLTPEWFDIRDLVKRISSSLAETAHHKQVELLCWVEPKVAQQLLGDQLRIAQILFNLLGNAVKFTDKGYIRVELTVDEGTGKDAQPNILIKVADTGVGIAQERLEKVFDCFWQGDDGPARGIDGFGLGNTVVRNLTRMMGGTVVVDSQLGVGSEFIVRLPLKMRQTGLNGGRQLQGRSLLVYEQDSVAMALHRTVARELGMQVITATRPSEFLSNLDKSVELLLICDSMQDSSINEILYKAHAVVPEVPLILAGYRGCLTDTGMITDPEYTLFKPFLAREFEHMAMRALGIPFSEQSTVEPAAIDSGDAQVINILLADNNIIAAKVFSTQLLQRGHKVKIAKDGNEALQAVSDGDYELAFIDLGMPEIDGLEFARRYRNMEPNHRYMHIYALVVESVQELFDPCIEAGMDGLLGKPVVPETLDEIIEQCKANLNRRFLAKLMSAPT
jgi:two-component system sensor histidine kinase RpfC